MGEVGRCLSLVHLVVWGQTNLTPGDAPGPDWRDIKIDRDQPPPRYWKPPLPWGRAVVLSHEIGFDSHSNATVEDGGVTIGVRTPPDHHSGQVLVASVRFIEAGMSLPGES